ncbi:MAG: glycogen/starch synthase, partial [Planctomycetes bacterium]|nr:glycogen/starch synthase [Planctomycetota bacterium]
MRVFMLGWEFPPYISGGLGTACYGLTKAMDDLGVKVSFVIPKPTEDNQQTHVKMLSPLQCKTLNKEGETVQEIESIEDLKNTTFHEIPSLL